MESQKDTPYRVWTCGYGNKLDEREKKAIFLGYPKGVQGNQLQSVDVTKFAITDVTCDERSMVALSKAIMPNDGDVGKTMSTQVVEIECKD